MQGTKVDNDDYGLKDVHVANVLGVAVVDGATTFHCVTVQVVCVKCSSLTPRKVAVEIGVDIPTRANSA